MFSDGPRSMESKSDLLRRTRHSNRAATLTAMTADDLPPEERGPTNVEALLSALEDHTVRRLTASEYMKVIGSTAEGGREGSAAPPRATSGNRSEGFASPMMMPKLAPGVGDTPQDPLMRSKRFLDSSVASIVTGASSAMKARSLEDRLTRASDGFSSWIGSDMGLARRSEEKGVYMCVVCEVAFGVPAARPDASVLHAAHQHCSSAAHRAKLRSMPNTDRLLSTSPIVDPNAFIRISVQGVPMLLSRHFGGSTLFATEDSVEVGARLAEPMLQRSHEAVEEALKVVPGAGVAVSQPVRDRHATHPQLVDKVGFLYGGASTFETGRQFELVDSTVAETDAIHYRRFFAENDEAETKAAKERAGSAAPTWDDVDDLAELRQESAEEGLAQVPATKQVAAEGETRLVYPNAVARLPGSPFAIPPVVSPIGQFDARARGDACGRPPLAWREATSARIESSVVAEWPSNGHLADRDVFYKYSTSLEGLAVRQPPQEEPGATRDPPRYIRYGCGDDGCGDDPNSGGAVAGMPTRMALQDGAAVRLVQYRNEVPVSEVLQQLSGLGMTAPELRSALNAEKKKKTSRRRNERRRPSVEDSAPSQRKRKERSPAAGGGTALTAAALNTLSQNESPTSYRLPTQTQRSAAMGATDPTQQLHRLTEELDEPFADLVRAATAAGYVSSEMQTDSASRARSASSGKSGTPKPNRAPPASSQPLSQPMRRSGLLMALADDLSSTDGDSE